MVRGVLLCLRKVRSLHAIKPFPSYTTTASMDGVHSKIEIGNYVKRVACLLYQLLRIGRYRRPSEGSTDHVLFIQMRKRFSLRRNSQKHNIEVSASLPTFIVHKNLANNQTPCYQIFVRNFFVPSIFHFNTMHHMHYSTPS